MAVDNYSGSYAELHARSAFSFLRGGSIPEDLMHAALAAGLPAVALLDRDGVYGAPRFFGIAHENKFAVRPRVGAEITMEDGTVVPLLATSRVGYQNLCQLITEAKLVERAPTLELRDLPPHVDPQERKRPCFATWAELERFSEGLVALTGDEEGPVRHAWRTQGRERAGEALDKLKGIFGRESDPSTARLFVEIQRQRLRGEEREIGFLRDLAASKGLPLVATGGVNYAIPQHRIVADVFTCLRMHTTLDAAGRSLAVNSERHIRSAEAMRTLFGDHPDALDNTLRMEERLDFTLENLGYQFPTYDTPNGESMDSYLREQTFRCARERLGPLPEALEKQLNKELELIGRLKFAGYFLIVWDICDWARRNEIIVQGRGSAANSAVCYVLGR